MAVVVTGRTGGSQSQLVFGGQPCSAPFPKNRSGPVRALASPGTVTWHPTNAVGDFDISQYLTVTAPANLVGTGTIGLGATAGVRAASPAPSSDFLFELMINTLAGGSPDNVCVGIDGRTVNLGAVTALPADFFGYNSGGGIFENGAFTQAATVGLSGQIVTVAGSRTNGTLKLFLGGVQQGATVTGISLANWYAYACATQGDVFTANFSGPFAYPQAGYSAYDPGPGATTYNDNLSEAAAAFDSSAAAQTFVNALAENTTPGDSYAAAQVMAGSLNEATAPAAAMATAATFAAADTEIAVAADALTSQAVFGSALSESASAAEALGVGLAVPASIGESVTPGDASVTTVNFSAAEVESAAAGDSASSAQVVNEMLGENAVSSDGVSAGASTYDENLSESVAASDQASASAALSAGLAESAAAVASIGEALISGALGRPKVWTGSEFVAKPIMFWTGSNWAEKPLKRWDGAAWADAA